MSRSSGPDSEYSSPDIRGRWAPHPCEDRCASVTPSPGCINRFTQLETDFKLFHELVEDTNPVVANRSKSAVVPSATGYFKSLLLDYSRAIMTSTINHLPSQSQNMGDIIITTKDTVIAHYENTVQDLKIHISMERKQVRWLEATKATQELELQSSQKSWDEEKKTSSMLRRKLAEERSEKEKYKKAWEEGALMREEYEDLKEEKKRKRQRAVEIWEKAEKAKVMV
jgi:hypothetical protein